MKLRNKKTGEVFDALVREKGGCGSYSLIVCDIKAYEQSKSTLDETHFILDEYDSLDELNSEWEDYEEPKEYWYIEPNGVIARIDEWDCCTENDREVMRLIGNYFESEEEAERAVEKLKAWKRLKDKGFRFGGVSLANQCIHYRLYTENDYLTAEEFKKANDEFYKDLYLLFREEEE